MGYYNSYDHLGAPSLLTLTLAFGDVPEPVLARLLDGCTDAQDIRAVAGSRSITPQLWDRVVGIYSGKKVARDVAPVLATTAPDQERARELKARSWTVDDHVVGSRFGHNVVASLTDLAEVTGASRASTLLTFTASRATRDEAHRVLLGDRGVNGYNGGVDIISLDLLSRRYPDLADASLASADLERSFAYGHQLTRLATLAYHAQTPTVHTLIDALQTYLHSNASRGSWALFGLLRALLSDPRMTSRNDAAPALVADAPWTRNGHAETLTGKQLKKHVKAAVDMFGRSMQRSAWDEPSQVSHTAAVVHNRTAPLKRLVEIDPLRVAQGPSLDNTVAGARVHDGRFTVDQFDQQVASYLTGVAPLTSALLARAVAAQLGDDVEAWVALRTLCRSDAPTGELTPEQLLTTAMAVC